MNKVDIISFLKDNDLTEIEEISVEYNVLALKFYYDFDKIELDAARAYANEETDYEEESIEWIQEGIIPYLQDLANDTVGEIIEDAMDEFQLSSFINSSDISTSNYEYKSFIVVFSDEDDEINVEEIGENLVVG
ncbi:hypothetical protein [Clostridium tarantellae]|uniref:Uncharacterized protein n=1 Tax=Clostridium tarantellae TaxID=39493 RepID=A0A6I1MMD2_9CLOT|nr:hypothetical protein [Clostridium tarantellae]MPQ43277.1 hypothetical protein [Clostridium tarantellae]